VLIIETVVEIEMNKNKATVILIRVNILITVLTKIIIFRIPLKSLPILKMNYKITQITP